jgi:hypothetical protein
LAFGRAEESKCRSFVNPAKGKSEEVTGKSGKDRLREPACIDVLPGFAQMSGSTKASEQ